MNCHAFSRLPEGSEFSRSMGYSDKNKNKAMGNCKRQHIFMTFLNKKGLMYFAKEFDAMRINMFWC